MYLICVSNKQRKAELLHWPWFFNYTYYQIFVLIFPCNYNIHNHMNLKISGRTDFELENKMSFNHKKGLLLAVFFSFNIVESLHHIRRWNNTRCFHLVNYSDENGSIKFWCVLILIISRVKDGSGSHFRAGSSKEWRSVRAHLIQNSIQYSKLCCVYGT